MHQQMLPYSIPDFNINSVTETEHHLEIHATSISTKGKCPLCGQCSMIVHGWYERHPQDLASVGCTVRLLLSVKRFRCMNDRCSRQTFAESLSSWPPRYSRRLSRLTQAIYALGLEVGAEVTHRILAKFQIDISGDTVLRILRRHNCAAGIETPLRAIGVDDWAFKRGKTYGTIIVNLQSRRVVDLLPDRSAETLARWLKKHPSIEIVTRDRSTDYAMAIRQGAPQAMQVADRWHLLLNLRQMLGKYLASIQNRLQQLPISDTYQRILDQQRQAFIRTNGEIIASNASRDRRVALYKRIQTMRHEGWKISHIAQALGQHSTTIRKYFYATQFPERITRQQSRSILDPYISYLEQRIQEGCENAQQLWREIQQRGYPGTNRQVMKWVRLKRTHVAPSTPHQHSKRPRKEQLRPRSRLPSTRQLAWLLVRDPSTLDDDDRVLLQHLLQDSQVASVYMIAQRFVRMVKQRIGEDFDSWLEACDNLSVPQVYNFIRGLRLDYAAVRAAVSTPWSNGQTEGQVNRLKFIKRQMYGRAKFDLLRLRVLAPP